VQQPRPVRSIGLPRMHKEAGERRDFLPALVGFLSNLGPERIVIERGYGSKMGFSEADYASLSRVVKFASLPECFAQDVVIVLRWRSWSAACVRDRSW
jgi:alanine dehydrogenase